MTVEVINDYNQKLYIESQLIKSLILNVLKFEGVFEADLIFILSNRNYLNKLKKSFFSKDHYTDVIAFNLNDQDEKIEGEIYISIDDVLLNSKEFNQSFNDEFKRVIIHGLLHILGHDDDTIINKKQMTKLENKYMKFLNKEIIKF
ncbi:MAG: rRNA maturation RNase YbeY [Candidatus Marinimicrobia bacterium]|nr:rRNA maturation RNase YbeY [Candidatus Neomarinimicrobiota bacterium]